MVAASIQYKPLRVLIQASTPYTKHLFLKPHENRADDLPKGRTLFVAGVPLSIAETDLVELFSVFGHISSAAVHPSKTTAILVFEGEDGLRAALEAADAGTELELTPAEPTGPVGLKAWVNAHKAQFPGNRVLQSQLDEWVEKHEAAEERKRKAAEEAADDGWTVVKRSRGRHKTTDGGSITVGGVAAAAAEEAGKKAKQGVAVDFYRFQQREQRRDELFHLREQFEADKQRIQELKKARRFKPL